MAFNIFKRKEEPIILDCYTASSYAYNYAKVDYSRKHIPEWWRVHPNANSEGFATIKHCTAFTDYYAKGIVIPLWGEVEITVHPLGQQGDTFCWRSSNEHFNLHGHNHSKEQWQGFGNDNMFNIKIISPWALKTRDTVYFSWSQPIWSQPDTFSGLTSFPAVMQFKTQSATHINYVLEQKAEQQVFTLPPLTPLAMLHPMTERKVELRHHLVNENTISSIMNGSRAMLLDSDFSQIFNAGKGKGLGAKKKAFWKKADELNKCPFE